MKVICAGLIFEWRILIRVRGFHFIFLNKSAEGGTWREKLIYEWRGEEGETPWGGREGEQREKDKQAVSSHLEYPSLFQRNNPFYLTGNDGFACSAPLPLDSLLARNSFDFHFAPEFTSVEISLTFMWDQTMNVWIREENLSLSSWKLFAKAELIFMLVTLVFLDVVTF